MRVKFLKGRKHEIGPLKNKASKVMAVQHFHVSTLNAHQGPKRQLICISDVMAQLSSSSVAATQLSSA